MSILKELLQLNEMASADELVKLTEAFVKVGHDQQMEGPTEDSDGSWSMFSDELFGNEIKEKFDELKSALTSGFRSVSRGLEWTGDDERQVATGLLASKTTFEIEMIVNEEGETHGGNIVVTLKV